MDSAFDGLFQSRGVWGRGGDFTYSNFVVRLRRAALVGYTQLYPGPAQITVISAGSQ